MDTLSAPRAPVAHRDAPPDPDAAPWHVAHRGARLRVIAWVQLGVLAMIGIGLLLGPAPFLLHHPGAVIDATAQLEGSGVADASFGEGGRLLLTTQRTTPLRWGGYLWFSAVLPDGARVVRLPPSAPRSHYTSLAAMDQSKDVAAAVAGCVVHGCTPEPVGIRVVGVTSGSPAARGGLRSGDVILAGAWLPAPRAYADDATAPAVTSVSAILRLLAFPDATADPVAPGRSVRVEVLRGGQITPLTISSDGAPLGAELVTAWVAQRGMEVDTGAVGGPSTGLMLTLTLVDAMTSGDLTGGQRVAGTGTIAPDGSVGPIGGVAAKVVGAVRARAEAFLVPPHNVQEARRAAPRGLKIVAVETLDAALRWLCGRGGASEACLPHQPVRTAAAGLPGLSRPH